MTDASILPPKAPAKALRIALAVSVALNLAVAGLAAGAFFTHGGPMGRGGDVRELGFGPFTEALSRDERDQLRKAFMAKRPEFRQARRDKRQDLQNLLTALRADPFDPAQLQALLGAQSQRLAQQMDLGQNLLSDLLLQMTPEARQAFADRLQQGLQRGRDKPAP
jgi:Spy/CpxP family protein refolding chaperone